MVVVLRVSRVEAGEGLLLLWGEWKLSHRQIPSYQCGHGGSIEIIFLWTDFKESVVLFLPDQNYFSPLNTSKAYFQTTAHRLDGGTMSQASWMYTLMAVWSDKASVLTGQMWEVSLFLCLYQLHEAGVVVQGCVEESHLNELLSATITSQPLYLRHLLWSPLAGCPYFSTHNIHSTVSVHLKQNQSLDGNHGNDLLPQQWLATTVTAPLGKASVDSCRTTLFSSTGL